MCLLSFGCLYKVMYKDKGAWVLIFCCCGKVNEKGAQEEKGKKPHRVLHQSAFMIVLPRCHQGQGPSCCSGRSLQSAAGRELEFSVHYFEVKQHARSTTERKECAHFPKKLALFSAQHLSHRVFLLQSTVQ